MLTLSSQFGENSPRLSSVARDRMSEAKVH
jgi:hypothetical protein